MLDMPKMRSRSRRLISPDCRARSHRLSKKVYRLAEDGISSLRFLLCSIASSKISHTFSRALFASPWETRLPSPSTRSVLCFQRWSGVSVLLARSTMGLEPVLAGSVERAVPLISFAYLWTQFAPLRIHSFSSVASVSSLHSHVNVQRPHLTALSNLRGCQWARR